MKKALKLIFMYIILIAAGLLIGTLFYSLFLDVLNFAAGRKMIILNLVELKKAFFVVAGFMMILICPLLIYTRIRHKGGVLQLIAFILLSCFSWFVCLPFIVKTGEKYSYLTTKNSQQNILTANYFRSAEGKVYYFNDDIDSTNPEKSSASTVVIDTKSESPVTIKVIRNSADLDLYKVAKPYNDILIKHAFVQDKMAEYVNAKVLLEKASSSHAKGGSAWIGFLSLGFVLCALYGMSNVNSWKLINSCVVICSSIVIIVVNILYYSPLIDGIKGKWLFTNKIVTSLNKTFDDPVLVLFNSFLGIIFILTGIVAFFKNRKSYEV